MHAVWSTHIERRDAVSGLSRSWPRLPNAKRAPRPWRGRCCVRQARRGSRRGVCRRRRENAGRAIDDDGHVQDGSSTTDDTTLVVLARLTGGAVDCVTFTDARHGAGRRADRVLGLSRPPGSQRRVAGGRSAGASPGRGSAIAPPGTDAEHGARGGIALTGTIPRRIACSRNAAPGAPADLRRDAALGRSGSWTSGARVIDWLSCTDGDDAFREPTLTGDTRSPPPDRSGVPR